MPCPKEGSHPSEPRTRKHAGLWSGPRTVRPDVRHPARRAHLRGRKMQRRQWLAERLAAILSEAIARGRYHLGAVIPHVRRTRAAFRHRRMSQPVLWASTWGSFCLRPAALRSPPALGGDRGSHRRTLCRSRHPSGQRGRLCVDRGRRLQAAPGDPYLLNHDPGLARAAGLAPGVGRHAGRDGEHWRLLEAGACDPGRPVRADRRQRSPHPQRARTQDRCAGCGVDRRPAPPWADPAKLRAAAADRRVAGFWFGYVVRCPRR